MLLGIHVAKGCAPVTEARTCMYSKRDMFTC